MRNESSLIHFLKTCELGPLNFSLSLEEVFKNIGSPDKSERPFAYMGEDHDHQINLYYKSLAIAFDEEVMVQFLFPYEKRLKGLPKCLNAKWFSNLRRKDYRFFVDYLKKYNIPCKRIIEPGDDEVKTLYIEHSKTQHIVITFDPDKKDRFISIICTALEPGRAWQYGRLLNGLKGSLSNYMVKKKKNPQYQKMKFW